MTAITDMVDLEKRGNVALLVVDNPPVNALSQGVRQGLVDGLADANADDEVEAVVLVRWKEMIRKVANDPLLSVIYLEADPRTGVIKVYQMLCEQLQQAGYLRKDFETVREFGDAIKRARKPLRSSR